ncbi:MAG: YfiM family protein [Bacteroidota bacterium]|nr:YfiM family protein [Bacteroidota bacterium]
MCQKIVLLFFCFLVMTGLHSNAQDSSSFWKPAHSYNKTRGKIVGIGLGTTYVVSMTGLYYLWYADYELGKFHLFNDNDEWLQMDKVGHFGSAYYLGKWGIDLMQWTGMPQKKAAWVGGSLGFAFLTTIEVFDGFSQEWGFSSADMITNVAGSAMAISQELLWQEQRMNVKFSFYPSKYNQYNRKLLGNNFPETLFKDYNGQTYWLSANIKSFLKEDAKFPSWLNIAVGYGAEGMTGARDNTNLGITDSNKFQRYRQFYLSPDIDLTKIKTSNGTLKTIFGVFGFLKIPLPALELNNQKNIQFHWLYF